jgi:hypothetical protein
MLYAILTAACRSAPAARFCYVALAEGIWGQQTQLTVEKWVRPLFLLKLTRPIVDALNVLRADI